MVASSLRCGEAFAEMTVAVVIQPPFMSSVLWTDDTVAWIIRPIAFVYRITEYPAKQSHGAGRRALPTGDDGAPPQLRPNVRGGFSGNHIALEFAGINGGEILDRSLPDQ